MQLFFLGGAAGLKDDPAFGSRETVKNCNGFITNGHFFTMKAGSAGISVLYYVVAEGYAVPSFNSYKESVHEEASQFIRDYTLIGDGGAK